ncbi:MAG TPA: YchF/TatD family DNA exonuclease [bacterium]
MLVDTHAHLDFEELNSDLNDVIKRAAESGVHKIITVGGGKGIESNRTTVDIAHKSDAVFATVGLHPENAEFFSPAAEETMMQLSRDSRVVGIGETGLDRKYSVPFDRQLDSFIFQINLARANNLPLMIHSRLAHREVIETLKAESVNSGSGVFHCFAGTKDEAREVLDLGFYISFTGIITFKNASDLRDVVKYVPAERLLLETDAPFLSPEPVRGKRNEPANVLHIARKVAELKALSLDDIARITSSNAYRLFGVGEIPEKGKIVYGIRDSLYLNITNRCTNVCVFCPKIRGSYAVKGYDLRIGKEPEAEEIIKAIGDPQKYTEVVFCGFGEPLLRLDAVKSISIWLKEKGLRVRIDTDGLASLVHGKNIPAELKGLVDSISVSMNAPDPKTYAKLCPSPYGEQAFHAVLEFIRQSKDYIPEVIATVVALPHLNVEECRKIADTIGVKFRIREHNSIG